MFLPKVSSSNLINSIEVSDRTPLDSFAKASIAFGLALIDH